MRISPIIRWFLFGVVMLVLSAAALAQVSVVIRIGPPALPVYEQPFCPGEGYLWVPGYWAYDYDYNDYYWVPGTWVLAPEPGLLWTPGYWAWESDRFFFHEGYWGPRVGFYGGIVYGFGYFGEGYEGGRWDHDRFFYNRAVNNVNVTEIHNVYNTTVINNVTVNRVSYNGGNGGIERRPTRHEEEAERERHIPPVSAQHQHIQEARADRQLHASVNQGRPEVAATPRPGAFHDSGVVRAREAGAPYRPEENRGGPQRDDRRVVHPRDLPPIQRPTPNAGGSRPDQKNQREQEKQFAKQEQERQKLQQKQEHDHQRLEQQRADDARRQQTEQRHQQQTQQLEQKHERQQQKMQERQRPSENRSKPSKEDRPPHGQA